ncbi:MAG TPA: hypothetical protein VK593_06520 [Edaphobacter sp.]|nr:hypothetical protein [Edaphobacter sp.]
MDFLKIFLRTLAFLPAALHGTEALFGDGGGEQKKKAALELVGATINITDAVTAKQIADPDRFTAGLSSIIDGVVECLNASVWAKP